MALGKKNDLDNLSDLLVTVNLFVMTSTNTAGISFERNHFDKGIHYYAA